MLLTTYLARLNEIGFPDVERKLEQRGFKRPKIYYVMRKRGNDAVAPSDELFEWWMQNQRGRKWSHRNWMHYRQTYLNQLERKEALEWMDRVAEESTERDVILVCFEKNHGRCHRKLLAKRIEFLHPEVNYGGEVV